MTVLLSLPRPALVVPYSLIVPIPISPPYGHCFPFPADLWLPFGSNFMDCSASQLERHGVISRAHNLQYTLVRTSLADVE